MTEMRLGTRMMRYGLYCAHTSRIVLSAKVVAAIMFCGSLSRTHYQPYEIAPEVLPDHYRQATHF